MRIFGVILAGGAGRRMGGADKALLRVGGRSLLSHAIARLEPQVERLAISANGDGQRFAQFGYDVLPDAGAARLGPMAGVAAGLAWLARPMQATRATLLGALLGQPRSSPRAICWPPA